VPVETEQFVALLQKAWQGEWYGVRVYGGLAASRTDASESAAMLELVVLETYVLGELTVALLGLGVEPDPGAVEAEADADVTAHASDDWATLLRWLQSDAQVALGHYLPLRELSASDPSLEELADLVVTHEEALITFAKRSLAGDVDALEDIRTLVRIDGMQ